ncbi:ATP-binding protein [Planobispora rosea]|uniref:ATP-binding protein n=1 Tax=Planobispora rosea TaxID=35762 RepID=UPI00083A161B|nr:ATP-binding protein [Planobispora rosea]
MTPGGAVLRRTVAFTLLYGAALVVGRLDMVGGTVLGLMWPAAGVGTVWLLVQRHERSRWLDALMLAAAAFTVNLMTGASPWLSAAFTAANLGQSLVFLRVFARLCPDLWNAPGLGSFDRVRHLWGLLAASLAGALLGALVGSAALGTVTGQWSSLGGTVWMARNLVSIVMITALCLRLGRLRAPRPRDRPRPGRRAVRDALGRVPGRRIAELFLLLTVSVVAYAVTFRLMHDLPLAFLLVTVTVWAAVRFGTTFVTVHDFVLGTAAIVFTLYGTGPFALIADPTARVLVAQVFVGMVAVIGLALALNRDEREALARRLAAAEREASAQAETLSAIVESMHDGLAVIDAEGRFVMRNPAAHRMLDPTGPPDTVDAYDLSHPDGTPIGREQLPYMLALAGHEVRGMDVLVHGPGRAGNRMLSVSATRLPDERAAVVVFHDVTEERRHRDELAAFAGVVAHDLLNPLTTIDGWTQVLAGAGSQAAGDDGAAGVGECVTRIRQASSRMRELIQDLLAHTTARDAPIEPVPIDLGPITREVAAARGDHSAGQDDGRAPVFHIGELDAVRADRALLRQLLDNLIGNAVKYTAEGERPEITVTSAADRPGWVRVEVADRGIGIPPGQHEMIFERFHRAHPGGPHGGSGLGLAICKHIVERHGGAIGVEDNPGGGSRFHFTLPAADVPDPRIPRPPRSP